MVKGFSELEHSGVLPQRRFFCSNFVGFCYALACYARDAAHPLYLMPLDYERVTPGEMAEFLDSAKARDLGWVRLGEIRG